jgi:hypothetical protein
MNFDSKMDIIDEKCPHCFRKMPIKGSPKKLGRPIKQKSTPPPKEPKSKRILTPKEIEQRDKLRAAKNHRYYVKHRSQLLEKYKERSKKNRKYSRPGRPRKHGSSSDDSSE